MSVVYDGLATYGRIQSVIGVVISTIFCILFIVISVVLFRKKQIKGDITAVEKGCNSYVVSNATKYNCNGINVKFIDNKGAKREKNNLSMIASRNITPGSSVFVEYSENKDGSLASVRLKDTSNKVGAWIMLIMGVLILAISWTWLYFSMKYKSVAAVGGTSSIVSQIFRRR